MPGGQPVNAFIVKEPAADSAHAAANRDINETGGIETCGAYSEVTAGFGNSKYYDEYGSNGDDLRLIRHRVWPKTGHRFDTRFQLRFGQ